MSLFCPKCGAKTNPEANFCAGCGKKLSHSSFATEPNTLKERPSPNPNDASSSDVNSQVRTLFVIGSNVSKEHEEWLKHRFPSSKIMRFSTIGAIREASKRLFATNQIESLCLMGTTDTVPTGLLHDNIESETQNNQPFWSVESDLVYVEGDAVVHELPEANQFWGGEIEFNPEGFIKRVNVDAIEGGFIPIGRIPSDEINMWKSYFKSIERSPSIEVSCVAISNFDQVWIDETKATLAETRNSGCANQSIYTLGALDNDDLDYQISNEEPKYFLEGSRIIVNLHGNLPSEDQATQVLVTDDPENYNLVMTSFDDFSKSVLYLFSCYGGNSQWWQRGGVIPHFLNHGGMAAVASSTCVWCSPSGEVMPGATLLCVEFFKSIDEGLTFGESLKLAKLKTFEAAMQVRAEYPWLFCMAVKEVFQFSLFGAPWARINHDIQNQTIQNKSSTRILDKVRVGNLNSALSAVRSGLSEINRVRSELHKTLGKEGIQYFSQTSNYVMNHLRKNRTLNEFTNELNSMGLDFEDASFETIVWEKQSYNLVSVRNEKKRNQVGSLMVLNNKGSLLAKMKVKG